MSHTPLLQTFMKKKFYVNIYTQNNQGGMD